MALKTIDRIQGTVSTTDAATTTTVVSYTVAGNAAFHAEAVVIGRNTSNGDMTSARLVAKLSRVSGTLSGIGSVLSVVTLGGAVGLATCTATIDVSGDTIRVRVTGVVATTIEWYSDMIIHGN